VTVHPDAFIRGIALVLKGESEKARCYVDHNASLGVLREKIVARFIRNETPERYRVETGQIRRGDHEPCNSRQIDLLVYDATDEPPLYRWEDFVVVRDTVAKAAIEVKTRLNLARFRELVAMHASVRKVNRRVAGSIPTFGYALRGVNFETFIGYLSDEIKRNRIAIDDPKFGTADSYQNLPACIVVQDRNYIAVTPCLTFGGPWYSGVVKYPRSKFPNGTETGMFIDLYSGLIRPGFGVSLGPMEVVGWFNRQDVPSEFKAYVDMNGDVQHGNMPLPA
jgi:hypothetical protein